MNRHLSVLGALLLASVFVACGQPTALRSDPVKPENISAASDVPSTSTTLETTTEPGEIEMIGADPVPIDEKLDANQETERLIGEYRPALASYRQVICYNAAPLTHGDNYSNLGHLLAAATLDAARGVAPEGVEVDFGLMNSGGIRDQIGAGPITWEDCIKVMPFDNKVVILRLDEAQRRQFENGLAKWAGSSPIAGAQMVVQPEPLEWRLYREGTKTAIPSEGPLVIAVSDYLAKNFRSLSGAERLVETDILVRTALKNYLIKLTENGKKPLVYWPAPSYLKIPMSMLDASEKESEK